MFSKSENISNYMVRSLTTEIVISLFLPYIIATMIMPNLFQICDRAAGSELAFFKRYLAICIAFLHYVRSCSF